MYESSQLLLRYCQSLPSPLISNNALTQLTEVCNNPCDGNCCFTAYPNAFFFFFFFFFFSFSDFLLCIAGICSCRKRRSCFVLSQMVEFQDRIFLLFLIDRSGTELCAQLSRLEALWQLFDRFSVSYIRLSFIGPYRRCDAHALLHQVAETKECQMSSAVLAITWASALFGPDALSKMEVWPDLTRLAATAAFPFWPLNQLLVFQTASQRLRNRSTKLDRVRRHLVWISARGNSPFDQGLRTAIASVVRSS